MVGYNNGFHVWDLSALQSVENKVSELVSFQGFKVKGLCVLDPIPSPIGKAPVDRPVIAIISGEEASHGTWPNTKLLLYSLRTGNMKGVELGTTALGVCANSTAIVVVCDSAFFL